MSPPHLCFAIELHDIPLHATCGCLWFAVSSARSFHFVPFGDFGQDDKAWKPSAKRRRLRLLAQDDKVGKFLPRSVGILIGLFILNAWHALQNCPAYVIMQMRHNSISLYIRYDKAFRISIFRMYRELCRSNRRYICRVRLRLRARFFCFALTIHICHFD